MLLTFGRSPRPRPVIDRPKRARENARAELSGPMGVTAKNRGRFVRAAFLSNAQAKKRRKTTGGRFVCDQGVGTANKAVHGPSRFKCSQSRAPSATISAGDSGENGWLAGHSSAIAAAEGVSVSLVRPARSATAAPGPGSKGRGRSPNFSRSQRRRRLTMRPCRRTPKGGRKNCRPSKLGSGRREARESACRLDFLSRSVILLAGAPRGACRNATVGMFVGSVEFWEKKNRGGLMVPHPDWDRHFDQ